MAYSISQFENNLTNPLQALDNNFTTFGALVPIPCSVSGTNALVLTQNAVGLVPTPTISGYSTNMLFSGIAAATNTATMTATIGATGVLNVYKDGPAGPVLCSGGEVVINCAFTLRYDAALNTGAGGFHLTSSTAGTASPANPSVLQVNGGSSITNFLSGSSPTLTFTATPGLTAQDQTFTLTALAAVAASALPAPGDFMQVSPPSLVGAGVGFQAVCTTLASLNSTSSVATINIRLSNLASASLASNSGVYKWSAMRTVP